MGGLDKQAKQSFGLPARYGPIPRSEVERLEGELLAVPTSFLDEWVVKAPSPIGGEVCVSQYPDD